MVLFSQRKGIRPVTKALQKESMDDDLRNRLWTGIQIGFWNHLYDPLYEYEPEESPAFMVEWVVRSIWIDYFKEPLDTLPGSKRTYDDYFSWLAYQRIRTHFFQSAWWESYDLIEFLMKRIPKEWQKQLRTRLNHFLKEENSAYRLVGDEVIEILDEHETEAIESALDKGIRASDSHLSRALELLSDRKQPDYRNSIKESISAVEATCQVFTDKPKATLRDCLQVIKRNGTVHPALEEAFKKLYGYTSDDGGIRHAMTENSVPPSFSDAKFMLVGCSGFINFLWTKASELGIDIKG